MRGGWERKGRENMEGKKRKRGYQEFVRSSPSSCHNNSRSVLSIRVSSATHSSAPLSSTLSVSSMRGGG